MPEWADEPEPALADQRWPMTPNDLLPRERWRWWEQLWSDVCGLHVRYRLGVRSG